MNSFSRTRIHSLSAFKAAQRSHSIAATRRVVRGRESVYTNAARALLAPTVWPQHSRPLSTSTASLPGSTPPSSPSPAAAPKTTRSNVFLDNLGSVFLAGLAALILSLARSFAGSTNRNKLREIIQEQASLDPLEIDDLRVANDELDLTVFRTIAQQVSTDFIDQTATYREFVDSVRRTMHGLKGEAFTIQLGHLLDRVVLDVLQERGQSSEDPQPVAFWLTVLSLALTGPVPERTRALFETLEQTGDDQRVTIANVRNMVNYLQETCQLAPESQVVENGRQKYPVQQYERGRLGDLFEWGGSDREVIDVDAFSDILRSRAVCAWGECYQRRRNV